jgi:hypothetical protein
MKKLGFQGTFLECVRNFRELTSGLFGVSGGVVSQKLKAFLGTKNPFRFWFVEENLPRGENLLKLELFLDCLGYDISEEISGRNRWGDRKRLVEIIATGVASSGQIGEVIEGATSDNILRWARGEIVPTGERLLALEGRIISHFLPRANMEMANNWFPFAEEILSLLQIRDEVVTAENREDSLPAVGDQAALVRMKEAVITSLAQNIKTSIPLARVLLGDDFSAEDRKKLRDLTADGSSHGVFELSNLLNGLCGEKARTTTRK